MNILNDCEIQPNKEVIMIYLLNKFLKNDILETKK